MYQLKVGDKVIVTGDSSFCDYGSAVITNIKTKYDEDTGEPYIAYCADDQWFDGRNGWAISPPLAYYIKELRNGHN